jgi:hypothetical protein
MNREEAGREVLRRYHGGDHWRETVLDLAAENGQIELGRHAVTCTDGDYQVVPSRKETDGLPRASGQDEDEIITRLYGIEARLDTIGQRIGSGSTDGILGLLGRIEIMLAVLSRQGEKITEHLGLTEDEDGTPVRVLPFPEPRADGHAIAREQIAKHGKDRYPAVSAQYAKILDEAGELGEALMAFFAAFPRCVPHDGGTAEGCPGCFTEPADLPEWQRVRDEYADAGLALYALGNKLGLDLTAEMGRLVAGDARDFREGQVPGSQAAADAAVVTQAVAVLERWHHESVTQDQVPPGTALDWVRYAAMALRLEAEGKE